MMDHNDVFGWGAVVDQINREAAAHGVVAPRVVGPRLAATDFSPSRKSGAELFRSTSSRSAPVISTAAAPWSAVVDLLNQQCAATLPGFVIPGGNSK